MTTIVKPKQLNFQVSQNLIKKNYQTATRKQYVTDKSVVETFLAKIKEVPRIDENLLGFKKIELIVERQKKYDFEFYSTGVRKLFGTL